MKKLIEGQKLWWVSQRGRDNVQCEVAVVKVGRKWAQLNNWCRIDVGTLVADGGEYQSPGCCYLSQSAYEDAVELTKAWADFTAALQYKSVPEGCTVQAIASARRLLGV